MNSPATITILSHNVFWFQGVPFLTDRPGPPLTGVISGLLKLYRASAPDVVCLQEVQVPKIYLRT